MARLYTNENFPLPAVEELRRLGHDCLTVAESGNSNIRMTDQHVLAFATTASRAVVTLNRRHFMALHQRDAHHGGIIVCTVDPDFAALARHIHDAIEREQGNLAGKLVRVTRGS